MMIPITDLVRLTQAEGLRYIGFRHEQSAGNAAAIASAPAGMSVTPDASISSHPMRRRVLPSATLYQASFSLLGL